MPDGAVLKLCTRTGIDQSLRAAPGRRGGGDRPGCGRTGDPGRRRSLTHLGFRQRAARAAARPEGALRAGTGTCKCPAQSDRVRPASRLARMDLSGQPLDLLVRMYAGYHSLVLRAARADGPRWGEARVRRIALNSLALLEAMLRRLIFLLAAMVRLGPLRPRHPPLLPAPRRPRGLARYRFRLDEMPRERWASRRNPEGGADPPELMHALFMARLENLAAVYRARMKIARRAARRLAARHITGRPALRCPPVPQRLIDTLSPEVRALLLETDRRTRPDTS